MRVVLVHCHPSETSLSFSLKETILKTLRERGNEVICHCLYEDDFDPVLHLAEWQNYQSNPSTSSLITAYQRDLETADGLIFVYPSWWYGPPAILKGYFDCVWMPELTFQLRHGQIHRGKLSKIRRLAVVTTYGSSWWWVRMLVGEPGRKLFGRGIKPLLAPGCRFDWLACYGLDRTNSVRIDDFVKRVTKRLRSSFR